MPLKLVSDFYCTYNKVLLNPRIHSIKEATPRFTINPRVYVLADSWDTDMLQGSYSSMNEELRLPFE